MKKIRTNLKTFINNLKFKIVQKKLFLEFYSDMIMKKLNLQNSDMFIAE